MQARTRTRYLVISCPVKLNSSDQSRLNRDLTEHSHLDETDERRRWRDSIERRNMIKIASCNSLYPFPRGCTSYNTAQISGLARAGLQKRQLKAYCRKDVNGPFGHEGVGRMRGGWAARAGCRVVSSARLCVDQAARRAIFGGHRIIFAGS